MKQLIRKILKEESLKQTLLDQIKQDGYLETTKLVGGPENLISILGEDVIMDMLMSCFTDLNVIKRGDDVILRDNHLHILENKSSFWGLPLIVYNDYIEIRISLKLGDDMVNLYRNVRRDFIRELVKIFPELYVEDVDVYQDSGLYNKIDSFSL